MRDMELVNEAYAASQDIQSRQLYWCNYQYVSLRDRDNIMWAFWKDLWR